MIKMEKKKYKKQPARSVMSLHKDTLERLMKYKTLELRDYNKVINYLIDQEQANRGKELTKLYTHNNPITAKGGIYTE